MTCKTTIRKGSSYEDRPPHVKTEATEAFERQLELEQRVSDLESLVRDLYEEVRLADADVAKLEAGLVDAYALAPGDNLPPSAPSFRKRMAALGMLEGGES